MPLFRFTASSASVLLRPWENICLRLPPLLAAYGCRRGNGCANGFPLILLRFVVMASCTKNGQA